MGLVEIIGAGALIGRAGGDTTYHWAGAIVDVDDDTALQLMEQGVAIESDGTPRETASFVPEDGAFEPADQQQPVNTEQGGLGGMTVQELRHHAKRNRIKVPADIRTREALLEHIRTAPHVAVGSGTA